MENLDNHQQAWLDEELPPGPQRVLDAGCGRGELAAALIRRGHEVTAIDSAAEAVAAARAAGVPALRADLTVRDGAPFYDGGSYEVIVMSLSLHHMHPLGAALDHAYDLLIPGGTLLVDEFAWDWADAATAAWFYDAGSLLAAAGVADFPREGGDPAGRWRAAHHDHHPAADMLTALGERFEVVSLRREPYITRYIGGKVVNGHTKVVEELWRIERDRLAAGALAATGFRMKARKV
ncbi:class I SAM-dependent methyltransferase [Nonomuraea sp. NPDC050783]|uniref:class I SAM-dependent methyltransferase n=1 Tax=Nonomuraea sp. NPDC050783 TaxID=3154634 RepID=UPI003465C33E